MCYKNGGCHMKLRYYGLITLIVVTITIGLGLYYKSSYRDYNQMETPLDEFAIALLGDDLFEPQLECMKNYLDSSNIIIAARCEEKFRFRYSCTTQEVSVVKVFRGEGMKAGDVLDIVRDSSLISSDDRTRINGKLQINLGFVNEMIPGKTYLLFMEGIVPNYTSETIYSLSDRFIIAPIFCYEDIKNIPNPIVDDNFRFTDYDNVKNNEYFITSEEADKKIREFKKEVLSKYPC